MSNPKPLGPQFGYVEILNHYTQEHLDEQSKAPRKYNPLRPSSAGKDPRELAYEWMEYRGYATYPTESQDPESSRLLKLGGVIEKHLLYEFSDALKRAGGDVEVKYQQQTLSFFELPDGSLIEGNLDAVFISKSKQFGGCVMDVKSKKDKFSQFYKTNWDELSAKLEGMKTVTKFGIESYWVDDLPAFLIELNDYFFAMNFKQLNMYFHDEHGFLRERGVDHCAIIQYNKNDSRLREIRFRPSQAVYEEVKNKFSLVQKIVDETKDPTQVPRENILGSVAVAFSKYRDIDWPEEDALKAYFKQLPAKQWPKDIDRMNLSAAERQELEIAFGEYLMAQKAVEVGEKAEEKIIKILEKHKTYKIRFDEHNVYQMKKLKTGGVAGKGQLVLRRSKV